LSAYTIRVREKNSKAYKTLDLFDEEHDFLEVCSSCLEEQLKVKEHDEESQHLIALDKLEKADRTVYGLIHSGDYGQACDVVNAKHGKVVYNKTVTDADMLPFYFRIEVPADSNVGLLIVQKGSSFTGGIKTALVNKLRAFFEKKHEKYKVDFDPLLPQDVIKNAAKKGSILSVKFIHFGLPKDIADRYKGKNTERWGSMELVFKARRNSALPLKQELLDFISKKDKKIGQFYELKNFNFAAQEVKVDVRVGRQQRRSSLGHMTSSPLYEVTEEVTIGKDGIATLDSIHKAAEHLAEGLQEGIYGEVLKV
jgi:hypothetical protein